MQNRIYKISFYRDIPDELLVKYKQMDVMSLSFNTRDDLINFCIRKGIKHVKIIVMLCTHKHG